MNALKPIPVSAEAFAPDGKVLDKAAATTFNINDGYAVRYDSLAVAEIQDGTAQLAIFSAKKRAYPMEIDMMERHPLGTQAFYPLQAVAWYAIVSNAEVPAADNLTAFSVPADVGLQYNRNIWHYPLLIEADSQDFLIMDYSGDKGKENLEIFSGGGLGKFAIE